MGPQVEGTPKAIELLDSHGKRLIVDVDSTGKSLTLRLVCRLCDGQGVTGYYGNGVGVGLREIRTCSMCGGNETVGRGLMATDERPPGVAAYDGPEEVRLEIERDFWRGRAEAAEQRADQEQRWREAHYMRIQEEGKRAEAAERELVQARKRAEEIEEARVADEARLEGEASALRTRLGAAEQRARELEERIAEAQSTVETSERHVRELERNRTEQELAHTRRTVELRRAEAKLATAVEALRKIDGFYPKTHEEKCQAADEMCELADRALVEIEGEERSDG